MLERLIALIGENNLKLIESKNILLIGLGGVGGYAFEALVRTGFKNITIVDYDVIDASNLNRQIITNINNIGEAKVKEAEKRAKLINDSASINALDIKVNESNIEDILNNNFDYVLDACDTRLVKFLLMKYKNKYGYKLISSMGTAKKLDPTKLKITTLDKTNYDPLARRLREMVKKEQLNGKFYVVSSDEIAKNTNDMLGSIVTVPAVSGLYMVSYVINDIVKKL